MDCLRCGGFLEEVSRSENKRSLRCEDCGSQTSEFIKKEIDKKIEVKEWKSICVKCKKLFVGNKTYCSTRCWRIHTHAKYDVDKMKNNAKLKEKHGI